MVLDRRRLLASGFALGVSPLIPSGYRALASSPNSQPMAVIAKGAGILFGASISEDAWRDPAYQALYLAEVGIITTDKAMKFDYVRPDPTRYDFDEADRIVKFGKSHQLPVRGHTLVWNSNLPDWIKRASNSERRYEFDKWLDIMVARYRGRLHSWDVVNEPFWPGHGEPGGYRSGPWYSAYGTDYVSRAFQRVHAVDDKTTLVLNEAQTEHDDRLGRAIRKSLIRLVDQLLDKGVRLDAIGLQGHLSSKRVYSSSSFSDFLWALSERNVDLYITELDVNDEAFSHDVTTRDQQSAHLYRRFLDDVLAVPAVKTIITWELSDKYSWYRGNWYLSGRPDLDASRPIRPLLFDTDMKRKPAWYEMASALQVRRNTITKKRR